MQDLQIFLGAAPFVLAFTEPVVSQAEACRRKEIVAVGVVRKRAWLADQRIDHVPVMHGRAVPADQTRQRIDELVGIPNFHAVGEQPRFDLLADQAAMDRIDVAMDVNQTPRVDPARHLQTRRQPLLGQAFERGLFLGEAVAAAGVAHLHQVFQEVHVVCAAGEIAAAAQQQRLLDGALEVPVRRLRVAVLVRLPRVDALARQAVMRQQVAIAGLELARRRQIVDGGGEAVAAVPARHAAQFPQRILQTIRKSLERLGRTQRHRLPVREGQNEVIHHVLEAPAGNGDAERVHVAEVRRRQIARMMNLAKHDGLRRSMSRSPLPHAPLEGAPMRIAKLTRMLAPQPVEQRLGQQAWLRPQTLLDRRPNRRERIGPRAVEPRRLGLLPRARQRALIEIGSSRLVAHAGPPGRRGQRCSRVELTKQSSYLAIRNHRIPPILPGGALMPEKSKRGNSNCR